MEGEGYINEKNKFAGEGRRFDQLAAFDNQFSGREKKKKFKSRKMTNDKKKKGLLLRGNGLTWSR